MRISITGDLGSGKSTVCRIIERRTGAHYYSTGSIQRSLAQSLGMTTYELNVYSETHPEVDKRIDERLCELSQESCDMVFDSRMAWHFVKDTLKVFITVAPEVAAARVLKASRGNVEKYANAEDAMDQLFARRKSENLRYSEKYGVDCADLDNFDLIIDSSLAVPEAIADVILEECALREKGLPGTRCYLSPALLDSDDPAGNVSGCDGGIAVSYDGERFRVTCGFSRAKALITQSTPLIPCDM